MAFFPLVFVKLKGNIGPGSLVETFFCLQVSKIYLSLCFPGGSVVKNLSANAGDLGSIPGLGRSPGVGNGNPLQYSYLENPMDRGAWRAIIHRIAQSQSQLSDLAQYSIYSYNVEG